MNPILSSVVGLCKRGWCASTPPSCWSKEDGPWRAISRLSFSTCALRSSSYCRAHKVRREREESRVRTRARVHEKNSNIRQRERQHHHLSRGVVEKEGERNERTVARGKEILPPNPPLHPLQPLPPLVGLPVSPQCAKDVD